MNKNYQKGIFYLDGKAVAEFYYKKNKEQELKILKNYTKEYKKLIDFFGFQQRKIKIKFVYSKKEMSECCGCDDFIAMVDDKDPYLIYFYSPLVFQKFTKREAKEMFSILVHETAHTFVTKINKRCFAWVSEGVCGFLEKKSLYSNIVKKKNWEWFKKNQVLLDYNMPWVKLMTYEGYKISYNLIKYIIKKYGKKVVFDLLKIRRVEDKKMKEKMGKILGENLDKFIIDFEKTLKLIK